MRMATNKFSNVTGHIRKNRRNWNKQQGGPKVDSRAWVACTQRSSRLCCGCGAIGHVVFTATELQRRRLFSSRITAEIVYFIHNEFWNSWLWQDSFNTLSVLTGLLFSFLGVCTCITVSVSECANERVRVAQCTLEHVSWEKMERKKKIVARKKENKERRGADRRVLWLLILHMRRDLAFAMSESALIGVRTGIATLVELAHHGFVPQWMASSLSPLQLSSRY